MDKRRLGRQQILLARLNVACPLKVALRNLSSLRTVPRDTRSGYLRRAIGLVSEDGTSQVQVTLQIHLASHLVDVGPDDTVGPQACSEAESLLTAAIPVLLAQGWTYLMPVASHTLSEVLMLLSRPSEALDAALEMALRDL